MMTESLTILGSQSPAQGVIELRIGGQLGWHIDSPLRRHLRDALGEKWNTATAVLNLSEVTFVDSAGVSALLSLHHEMRQAGGQLMLCALPPRISQMFEVVGMSEVVSIVSCASDAGVPLQP